jgi:hypothetical protein
MKYDLRSPHHDQPDILISVIIDESTQHYIVETSGAQPARLVFASLDDARAHIERVRDEYRQRGFEVHSRQSWYNGEKEVLDVFDLLERDPRGRPRNDRLNIEVMGQEMLIDFCSIDSSDGAKAPRAFEPSVLEAISTQIRLRKPRYLRLAVSCYPGSLPGPDFATVLDPSLEMFTFDSDDSLARQKDNSLGDISGVLAACPKLKRAAFTGRSPMTPSCHEHLEELRIIGRLDPSVVPALGASAFPALETLAIQPDDQDEILVVELARSLREIKAPRLRDVYVDVTPAGLEFLDALGTADLPWKLCVLDYRCDDIESLVALLDKTPALRAGRLSLDMGALLEEEVALLEKRGVMEAANTVARFTTWFW